MAPQATRIGLTFVSILALFVGVRSVMVPESFGQKGHYRYAAVAEIGGRAVKYAGKKPCLECHADVNSPHTQKGVSCETCHGPGAAHAEDFDKAKLDVNTTRAACGTCHAGNAARRTSFPQVDLAEHNPSQRCVECHKVHPAEEAKPEAGKADDAKPAADAKPEPAAKAKAGESPKGKPQEKKS